MSLSSPRRASAPDDGAPSGDRASSPDSSVATSRVVETLRAAGCVFAEDEAALLLAAASAAAAAGDPADLASMVARRTAGVPLEYVLGWAEFRGHRFALEEGVFVPRHRTGFLVGIATELAEQAMVGRAGRPVVIVDLCCGSGALGAVVAADLGGAGAVGGANGASGVELHAADVPLHLAEGGERLQGVELAAADGLAGGGEDPGGLAGLLREVADRLGERDGGRGRDGSKNAVLHV